uniref:U1-type domain-containing protein n=1 Tax=Graphocephala atropunctata TaxID=36148 RepID=A0A1B6KR73_9HEMI
MNMASGGTGTGSFSVLCHECNMLVEVCNGDVQSSMELHCKRIHNSSNKQRQNVNQSLRGQERYKNENYDTFFCPLCKKNIEILKSNFTRGVSEHIKSHDQVEVKPQSDDQLYTFSGIKNWIDNSKISEKSESSKNHLKNNQRRQNLERNTVRLPLDLKQHRGYIVDQHQERNFFCNVCVVTFDSTNIVEHLKTKTHEDNVILLFKGKLPLHLQNTMEFISFYNSNLSCNLCRCKVNLNSFNLYETIFNIISHNSDISHSSKRQNEPSSQNNIASSLMQYLSDNYPVIRDSKHLIETNMEPQFKCMLCDKSIIYSDKVDILAKNCLTHLNSSVHKKSEKAASILKSIESLNIGQGNHKFIVSNGNITCVTCKFKLETDINKVLHHINEVAQFKQRGNQSCNFNDESNQSIKSYQSDGSSNPVAIQRPVVKGPITGNNIQSNPNTVSPKVNKPNYRQLLKSLQQEFGNIKTLIVQNSRGEIQCTVCNCSVPPTTASIRVHLLGAPHQNKIQQMADTAVNPKSGGDHTKLNTRVESLFQSLPQKFQQDKHFIRDSPIDGYIVCSICDCVINPYYIRDHLVDENHLCEKKKMFG